ncbi:MAG: YlxM family DNA-binding protein [Muricomes sp.]
MIAEVINVNEILEQALLFDFYGELLTEHQKEIYEQFVLEDLSLSEIAQSKGISRQGVHDMVRRCQKILEGYENKLHLVDKFLSVKKKVQEMNEVLDSYGKQGTDMNGIIERVRQISDTIIEEL